MRRGETVTWRTPEARATTDIRYRRMALTHKKRCCEKEKIMKEVFFFVFSPFFFLVDLELYLDRMPRARNKKSIRKPRKDPKTPKAPKNAFPRRS